MKQTKRWLLPALLLVLVALVFSYGSFAAFTQSFSKSSEPISAKSFTFYVNESTNQKQILGDATLGAGESKAYQILLDGRSSEAPVDATVTLSYTYDGTWPDGFMILCDGQSVSSGYSRTFHNLESAGDAAALTFTVAWDDPHVDNYEPYDGFVLHMNVSVLAQQPE